MPPFGQEINQCRGDAEEQGGQRPQQFAGDAAFRVLVPHMVVDPDEREQAEEGNEFHGLFFIQMTDVVKILGAAGSLFGLQKILQADQPDEQPFVQFY